MAELWTVVGFLASPVTDLEGQVARAVAGARERLGEEVEVLVVGIRQALQDGRVVAPEGLVWASPSPSTFLLHSVSLRPAACTVATGALAVALPSTGCSTCNLALVSAAALAEHRETSQHKRNEEFLEVRPSLGLARRHPLGLEVTLVPGDARVAGGPPEAVVVDSHPGERVSFSLQLFNFRPSEVGEEWRGVVVARVAAPDWQDVLVVTDEHGVTREGEETRVRLRHGRRYRVTVTCSTRDVGEHRIPVVISFYHDLHSELAAGGEDRQLTLLGVEVVVRATTPELLAMLPTQPFQPPAREEPWRARETVRGLSPAPTFAKDFLVTRLPHHRGKGSRLRLQLPGRRRRVGGGAGGAGGRPAAAGGQAGTQELPGEAGAAAAPRAVGAGEGGPACRPPEGGGAGGEELRAGGGGGGGGGGHPLHHARRQALSPEGRRLGRGVRGIRAQGQ